MTAVALQADNFGRRYSRSSQWAVRHLSFEVPTGSITGLVGPNGAGKSTLMRGCVGFERPDEGRVLIAGFDPVVETSSALARLAYLPQLTALYGGFTAEDHFGLARVARRSFDRRLAVELLDAAGVAKDRRIRELSGGEQSQVALALALATRAKLLLLDEPLASLDPLARRGFLGALFSQARQDGSTVLLSSHLISDIGQVCDRILVLTRGRLVLEASLKDALSNFRVLPASVGTAERVVGSYASATGEGLLLV